MSETINLKPDPAVAEKIVDYGILTGWLRLNAVLDLLSMEELHAAFAIEYNSENPRKSFLMRIAHRISKLERNEYKKRVRRLLHAKGI